MIKHLLFLFTGLTPQTDSFDLLRADYIESLGFNSSFIEGFASFMHNNVLNTIGMGYSAAANKVHCDQYSKRHLICKIHRKQWAECVMSTIIWNIIHLIFVFMS